MPTPYSPYTLTYQGLTAKVTRTETIEHENGAKGWRSVPDGKLVGDVIVTIDIDAIAEELGRKALKAKSKKATAMTGKVKVVARNVQHIKGDQ